MLDWRAFTRPAPPRYQEIPAAVRQSPSGHRIRPTECVDRGWLRVACLQSYIRCGVQTRKSERVTGKLPLASRRDIVSRAFHDAMNRSGFNISGPCRVRCRFRIDGGGYRPIPSQRASDQHRVALRPCGLPSSQQKGNGHETCNNSTGIGFRAVWHFRVCTSWRRQRHCGRSHDIERNRHFRDGR